MDANTGSEKEKVKREYHSFYDIVHRMMLAGIGAVALKHDEIEEFVDKLVERGELAKKDREELMNEMREKYKQHHPEREEHMRRHVHDLMDRFAVPTKDDLAELHKKLSDLEQKIDKLSKSKE